MCYRKCIGLQVETNVRCQLGSYSSQSSKWLVCIPLNFAQVEVGHEATKTTNEMDSLVAIEVVGLSLALRTAWGLPTSGVVKL